MLRGCVISVAALAACATSGGDRGDGGVGSSDAMVAVVSDCPDDEFATAVSADGTLVCAPIDDAARLSMMNHCRVALGWRDSCDACQLPPTKWGTTSGVSCDVGVGADNTCEDVDLGGATVTLLSVNTDGDADGNDKFFVSLSCTPPADEPVAGPCEPGSFLSGIGGTGGRCVTAQGAIAEHLANTCEMVFGWRDSCDGCTDPPVKWGRTNSDECVLAIGTDNTCRPLAFGTDELPTLGLSSDGDINDDDKFYYGFRCLDGAPSASTETSQCPAGELVVGRGDGVITCKSPVPAAAAAVRDQCYLYAGWRDSCNGCSGGPTKWGRVGAAACEVGTGADNTCAAATLQNTSYELLGINTDGDVNGDDNFYIGLGCPSIGQ